MANLAVGDTLTFANPANSLGVLLGWLLGFIQYAAIAGVHQCVPSLVFSVQNAILVSYEAPKVSGDSVYLTDLLINLGLLAFHLFGSFAHCQDMFLKLFGAVYSDQKSLASTLQTMHRYINYFLVLPQAGQAALAYFAGDPILVGLYSGQVFGTGYMHLSELFNFELMR